LTVTPFIIPIPFRDPVAAFTPLASEEMAVLLDSSLRGHTGRYSYIAVRPFRTIRCTPYPWAVSVNDKPTGLDPFEALREEIRKYTLDSPPDDSLPPFIGGAIGFLAYELGGVLEKLPKPKVASFPWDMVVGLYDSIVAFDLRAEKAWVISSGLPENQHEKRLERAQERAKTLLELMNGEAESQQKAPGQSNWHAESTSKDYEQSVFEIKEAIYSGDIYQANFSQRFSAELPKAACPFGIYRSLCSESPAPFSAYMNFGSDFHILSASPERFLKVTSSGNIETRPIKGTRRRGVSPEEDIMLSDELVGSAKDNAENLMIVDLLRNDISRVCIPGSVEVPVLCGLESFPSVHHLVSVVTGKLRSECTLIDLLRAAFPGGSITGAPKIRAMEIIHEQERSARGPYCGTVFWAGFDGAMDSSITIRTIFVNGRKMIAQAGGGIVAESDPSQEYEESLIKVRPLLAALRGTLDT